MVKRNFKSRPKSKRRAGRILPSPTKTPSGKEAWAVAILMLLGLGLAAVLSVLGDHQQNGPMPEIRVSEEEAQLLAKKKAAKAMAQLLAKNDGKRIEWNKETAYEIMAAIKQHPLPDPNNWALCAADINKEPPNEWVEYRDEERGIIWQVPYNNSWGNESIVIRPFEEDESEYGFAFGPIEAYKNDCGWSRRFGFWYEPHQSLESLLKEHDKDYFPGESKVIQAGLHDIVIFKDTRLPSCESNDAVIIGSKYNYHISALCSSFPNAGELVEEMARRAEVF